MWAVLMEGLAKFSQPRLIDWGGGGMLNINCMNFKKYCKVKGRTGPAQWSSGSGRGSDDGSMTITGTLTLTLVLQPCVGVLQNSSVLLLRQCLSHELNGPAHLNLSLLPLTCADEPPHAPPSPDSLIISVRGFPG